MAAAPASRPVEPGPAPVEDIRVLIDRLVHERQRLRARDAAASELEANRLAIVYWQRRLTGELAAAAGR